MGDMDTLDLDERASQTYSVFFLGPGYLARETAQALITKSAERKRSKTPEINAPTIKEIQFYGRNRKALDSEIHTLRGKITPTGVETRITTPLDYLPQGDIEVWKKQWNNKAIVEAVLQQQPDVTVITIRSDKEDELRKQGLLTDRFARAGYNIPELEAYAPFFKNYKGVVLVVTNPPDICAQAFCAAARMDPEKVIGFNEIDSLSLRRYLFTDGPIFTETDFTGTPLEGPEKREERQRFLDIVGVGLEKLGTKKRDMYANIGALAFGAHGEDLAPVISGLKPEQIEAVQKFFERQGITGEKDILESIRTAVGSGIRKYYTDINERSHDVPGVIAELIDAIGLVAATRKNLREQKGNNAYALVPPTASVYVQPGTNPVKTWFGFPVDIRYDHARGVVVAPINSWKRENGDAVELSDAEKEMVSEAYGRYAAKVTEFIGKTKRGKGLGIETPSDRAEKMPIPHSPEKRVLLIAQPDQTDLRNTIISWYDTTTNGPLPTKESKPARIVVPGVGYRGVKAVNEHTIAGKRYVVAGHQAGLEVISEQGEMFHIGISSLSGKPARVDSTVVLDDILIAAKKDTCLHMVDGTKDPQHWSAKECAPHDTEQGYRLRAYQDGVLFLQDGAVKRLQISKKNDGTYRSEITTLIQPSEGQIVAYDVDPATGTVYAATDTGKDTGNRMSMYVHQGKKARRLATELSRLRDMSCSVDGEGRSQIAITTSNNTYCLDAEDIGHLLVRSEDVGKRHCDEPGTRIALAGETGQCYIVTKEKKVMVWRTEQHNGVSVLAENCTALQLV